MTLIEADVDKTQFIFRNWICTHIKLKPLVSTILPAVYTSSNWSNAKDDPGCYRRAQLAHGLDTQLQGKKNNEIYLKQLKIAGTLHHDSEAAINKNYQIVGQTSSPLRVG